VLDLEGVGPSLAVAIIARRDELGGFRSIEDVASIGGVGNARLEHIAEQAEVRIPRKARAR
jgi:competence protein ComEA